MALFPLSASTKNNLKGLAVALLLIGVSLGIYIAIGGTLANIVSLFFTVSQYQFLYLGFIAKDVIVFFKNIKILSKPQTHIEGFENIHLTQIKNEVATELGISENRISIGVDTDDTSVNAFAVCGFFSDGIVVTTGLLRRAKELASKAEANPECSEDDKKPDTYIKDILYHEMAHIKHRDGFKNVAIAGLSRIFTVLLGLLMPVVKTTHPPIRAIAFFLQSIGFISAEISITKILTNIIFRVKEKNADAVVFEHEGVKGVERMCETLSSPSEIVDDSDGDKIQEETSLLSYMYDKAQKTYSTANYYLNHEHPTIDERIAYAGALEADQEAERIAEAAKLVA